jgi:hypothetical protein
VNHTPPTLLISTLSIHHYKKTCSLHLRVYNSSFYTTHASLQSPRLQTQNAAVGVNKKSPPT